jgi:hypothetical protein
LVVPITGRFTSREQAALADCLRRTIPIGLVACGLEDHEILELTGIPESAMEHGAVRILRHGNLRGPFWDEGVVESYTELTEFVEELLAVSAVDITVPKGIAWYAFESDQALILVLEELRGVACNAHIETTSGHTPGRAVELLEGTEIVVETTNDGARMTVSLTASGAAVLMVEQ